MYYSPKSSTLRNTTAERLGSLSFLPSLLLVFTHRVAPAQEYRQPGKFDPRFDVVCVMESWLAHLYWQLQLTHRYQIPPLLTHMFFQDLFHFVYTNALLACMYVHHMCA